MEIVLTAARPTSFHLRESFLTPYHKLGDPFKSLLARSTYLSKYSRGGEVWTDTIRRVVEGNVSLVPGQSEREAELLFHLFWTGQALPPGRGLWVGGVEGIPADARYNCWGVTLRSIEDWCWVMNQLMLGGGVGVGLGELTRLGAVHGSESRLAIWCRADHSNVADVKPNDKSFLNGQTPVYRAPDSREGWVDSLRLVLTAAYAGKDLIVDLSDIRPRGEPIRTFGGTACGPGPLATLLRSAWSIVRGAEGRCLSSVECLDITNMIGFCVKSGNVRRSALIVLGDAEDRPFRDAKKDFDKVMSHRHTSNNSLMFYTDEQIRNFDWHGMVDDNILYGEPGLLNLALIRKTDPGAKVINPCLTGDTRVATQFGLVRISDLAAGGEALRVTTDSRVQAAYMVDLDSLGVVVRDAVPAFQTAPAAEVYRIQTRHGYQIKATAYHKFPTPDGFVELKDLQVGDSLLLQSAEGQWGVDGSEALGTTIGWLEGDGNFCIGEDDAYLRFWGAQKALSETFLPWCQEIAALVAPRNGHPDRFGIRAMSHADAVQIVSPLLGRALAEYGYREKGHVPEVVWRGSRECARGYLRGLFAADGQVNDSKDKKCFSIRLSQSNPVLLHEVQTLLLNFGIVSSVYERREAQWKRMPDGQGGMRDYWCAKQYDLVVAKQNAVAFADKIGFLLYTNAEAYEAWRSSWMRGPYRETFTDEIVAVESIGSEPVFCTTQPSHHTFLAAGIASGNCGEIPLHDREACNLAEAFPAKFDGSASPDTVFRLLTRYCVRQRMTPLLDEESDLVRRKNMRLGVGLGGICDFEWSGPQLAEWFGVCRREADDYAAEMGVARPNAVTTTKPSGTISLLNSSSPGIHAPFAPFYIRRARLADNDPMAEALQEAGVTWEHDKYDNTGHTLVFEFPTKATHTRVTVQTETIGDQFERQAMVQEWWADNSVSATLSFNPETERVRTAQLLEKYVPRFKSTSLLARAHGYVQAPYEEIDEGTYHAMEARIRTDHPLVRGGDVQFDECSTGVCPVR